MSNSYSFLIFIGLVFLFSGGCGANRVGTIMVADSLVWEDNAVAATSGAPYSEITKFGVIANQNLTALQGSRAHRYYQASGIRGAVRVQLPAGTAGDSETGNKQQPAKNEQKLVDVPALPDSPTAAVLPPQQSPGLTFTDLAAQSLNEDPIDLLQRADDFNQILNGLKLTHLRDTLSMLPGWSVYLLKFDISLHPGDITQEDHGARVRFVVEKDKEKVRIYGIWPQRYADRFKETSSLREDFRLALETAVQGPKASGSGALDLAQRSEEDLALIQRYPLVAGFIDRFNDAFGWEFNPRLRILKKNRWILPDKPEHVYWLEPGLRQVYALLAVKDCRIHMPKKLIKISENDLEKVIVDQSGVRLEELIEEYKRLKDPYAGDCTRTNLPDIDKAINRIKQLKEEGKQVEALKSLHADILRRIGDQGDGGLKKVDLKVERSWFNRKTGRVLAPEEDSTLSSNESVTSSHNPPLEVLLPEKVDRTLSGLTAVLPREGLIGETTRVTILGQNFSNDARVFVAGQEAQNVEVLGRDFITALLPGIKKELLNGEPSKKFAVTVFTGGEALQAQEAFTYIAPRATPSANPTEFKLGAKAAKADTWIKIVSNKPVMDKVVGVWFGDLKVDLKNTTKSKDNKTLEVLVPYDTKDKRPAPGSKRNVILDFDPQAQVISSNRFQLEEQFLYK